LARTRLRSPRLPSWRVAVAMLCLLAQAGGVVHLVLVQHQTCLEHASLGHGDGTDQAPATSDSAADHAGLSARPAAQHADDHCLVLALRKRDALPGPAPLALAPVPELVLGLSAATAHGAPPPVPLLSLAP